MNVKFRYAGIAAAGLTVGAAHTMRGVARQNSPFRRYWERHLRATLRDLTERVEAGEEMPLIYVALGDSAAQGLGARTVFEGYVPRFAVALEAMSGREVALLNISLSGGTCQSVLNTQLPQLAGLRVAGQPIVPDVVSLDIGGNDVKHEWMTESEFTADMQRIVEQLPKDSFIMNVPSFGPVKAEPRSETFSAIVDEVARHAGHQLIDIRELSLSMPFLKYAAGYHAYDMFHPNSPWYAIWAQRFADAAADVYGWEKVDVASLGPWSGPIATP